MLPAQPASPLLTVQERGNFTFPFVRLSKSGQIETVPLAKPFGKDFPVGGEGVARNIPGTSREGDLLGIGGSPHPTCGPDSLPRSEGQKEFLPNP